MSGVPPSPRVHPGLVLVGARRCLPPSLWIGAALLGSLFWWIAPVDPVDLSVLGLLGPDASGAEQRGRVWLLLWAFVAPVVVARAAGTARRWERGDADWLLASPLPRPTIALSLLAGILLACAAVTLVATLATELQRPHDPGTMRLARTLRHPAGALVEGDAPLRWIQGDLELGQLPAGARLSFHLGVAPGSGPAVSVRAAVSDEEGRSAEAGTRLHGRGAIDVPLPPGATGAATLTLERVGPGAVLVLPRSSVDVLVPAGSARLLSLALALPTGAALAAWAVLACGLGMWMRTGLATVLVLCLAALPCAGVLEAATLPWPGGDLPGSWQRVSAGTLPPWLGSSTVGGFLASLSVLVLGGLCTLLALCGGRGVR